MATAYEAGTNVGTFTCVSGKLRVTDPCYSPGTWCAGVINDCRAGTWNAVIYRRNFGDWGNRVARLTVTHADGGDGPAEEAAFEVGVDSGQAGVFDAANYDNCDGEYDKWCRLSSPAGTRKFGVVSSSGFGDGGYAATYRRGPDGKCFEISITFIGDEEE